MSYKHLAEALLLGKPYFGTALRAMQGVPERQQYFLPVVSSFPPADRPLDILEIGSWAGSSTVTWANALRESGRKGKVICVDPWEPYFQDYQDGALHYEQMNDAAREGLISRLFEHNVRAAGVADMVEVRRGTSRAVVPAFREDSFDIIYIDGSHRFEDVLFDIREAKRLLRDGGVICGDDLEIEAVAIAENVLRDDIASNRDFVCAASTACYYHPGVTGAVAQEFADVGVWNGFWAVRRCENSWLPAVLNVDRLHLPEHVTPTSNRCRLLESTPKYNLIEAEGTYFAVAKAVGEVDLFHEALGDRALPPVLLTGASLEAVRRAVGDAEAHSTATRPVLQESYRGFNLVAHNDRLYAVCQSLGPVDPIDGEVELQRRFGPENVFAADSIDVAKIRIDTIAASREVAFLKAEMAGLLDALASHRQTQAASTAELELAQQTRTSEFRAAIQELRSGLEALAAQQRAQATAAAENAVAQRTQASEIRDIVQELRSGLEKLSTLQYGPGDPEKPCLAGTHGNFNLVRYRGRVYGLLEPLDAMDIQWSEREFETVNGVICGDSVDGVRARIDVLESARELQAELAALNQKLTASDSRLTEAVRETNESVQAYARDVERLARNWLNRVFARFSK